jgi:hypothetical protein
MGAVPKAADRFRAKIAVIPPQQEHRQGDQTRPNALATGNNDKYQSLRNTDWETDCPSQMLFAQGG